MIDLRKIAIIFIVGILYGVFTFSMTNAIQERPDYNDYCRGGYGPYCRWDKGPVQFYDMKNCSAPVYDEKAADDCVAQKGMVCYKQNAFTCPTTQFCEFCEKDYQDANKQYDFTMFIVSSILGVIAVIIGLYLKPELNELNGWVGTGLLLGGLISIFGGTMAYYEGINRMIRPVVIMTELLVVIFVFYRTVRKSPKEETKKAKK